jgi:hypothetical protein
MASICKPESSKGTTEASCVKDIGKRNYTWYYHTINTKFMFSLASFKFSYNFI